MSECFARRPSGGRDPGLCYSGIFKKSQYLTRGFSGCVHARRPKSGLRRGDKRRRQMDCFTNSEETAHGVRASRGPRQAPRPSRRTHRADPANRRFPDSFISRAPAPTRLKHKFTIRSQQGELRCPGWINWKGTQTSRPNGSRLVSTGTRKSKAAGLEDRKNGNPHTQGRASAAGSVS